jgi:hypothetical protein
MSGVGRWPAAALLYAGSASETLRVLVTILLFALAGGPLAAWASGFLDVGLYRLDSYWRRVVRRHRNART